MLIHIERERPVAVHQHVLDSGKDGVSYTAVVHPMGSFGKPPAIADPVIQAVCPGAVLLAPGGIGLQLICHEACFRLCPGDRALLLLAETSDLLKLRIGQRILREG